MTTRTDTVIVVAGAIVAMAALAFFVTLNMRAVDDAAARYAACIHEQRDNGVAYYNAREACR
jgi:hypothetical protein